MKAFLFFRARLKWKAILFSLAGIFLFTIPRGGSRDFVVAVWDLRAEFPVTQQHKFLQRYPIFLCSVKKITKRSSLGFLRVEIKASNTTIHTLCMPRETLQLKGAYPSSRDKSQETSETPLTIPNVNGARIACLQFVSSPINAHWKLVKAAEQDFYFHCTRPYFSHPHTKEK